jgi:hypothetical protein
VRGGEGGGAVCTGGGSAKSSAPPEAVASLVAEDPEDPAALGDEERGDVGMFGASSRPPEGAREDATQDEPATNCRVAGGDGATAWAGRISPRWRAEIVL